MVSSFRFCLKCERRKESIKDYYFRDTLSEIISLRGIYKSNFPTTIFSVYKIYRNREPLLLDSLTLNSEELRLLGY